jgi:hypothetical protein
LKHLWFNAVVAPSTPRDGDLPASVEYLSKLMHPKSFGAQMQTAHWN